ncbi:MBL fold metallo-hydrolase [Capnocytophaga catalasegens]|uniref:MBL fold metallo-hydrolase n=2 Tax=Capnocytophaga catalasegens TaxID=1004260 RepID=A0AAV5AX84_9FLAO|nr:MBL fold metallo-hydrolase [Capnocytophaga catalasegens]GJM49608.1 MBL fold metallo-hydrolase [Capnocytophaga catalasegens]GJM52909.1 MBL fold metallo-hydrolase [Capnocytophaga catalasegens]
MNKMLYFFLAIVGLVCLVIAAYMQLPKFGKHLAGKRLQRIENSPNYKDGAFQNIEETKTFTTEDKTIVGAFWDFPFKKVANKSLKTELLSVKTYLTQISTEKEYAEWFGHSSYLIQTHGKRFLLDPVLVTGTPLPFSDGGMFKGSKIYKPNDIPEIDYLVITHDHWDHLDYETIKALRSRVGHVICPLGVGAHFEHWGFATEKITELDWNESTTTGSFTITCLPTRHFSGRGLVRNKTLWGSFMLETPTRTIYIGGDSGYGNHFKEIARKFPKIDFALLENGQYNTNWANIHFLPDNLVKVIQELNPKRVFPVHNSKFALAYHSWNEPLEKIYNVAKEKQLNVIFPKIGEKIILDDEHQSFEEWW